MTLDAPPLIVENGLLVFVFHQIQNCPGEGSVVSRKQSVLPSREQREGKYAVPLAFVAQLVLARGSEQRDAGGKFLQVERGQCGTDFLVKRLVFFESGTFFAGRWDFSGSFSVRGTISGMAS